MAGVLFSTESKYLILDRDGKFAPSFRGHHRVGRRRNSPPSAASIEQLLQPEKEKMHHGAT